MKTARLSEVCKLVNGGTPKSGVAEYWGGDVAWLTPAEMGKRTTPNIAETVRTISRIGLANCSARQVPVGAVIMSTRAPIGHLAIPEVPMSFNQGCRGLIPDERLNTKYLYYFLWFSRDALNELGTGATFKELSSGALGDYSIPLPPLEEQRRIVAVLDEAFAAIAIATANAEKNLANAREFFVSELNATFSTVHPGWRQGCLSDLMDVTHGFAFKGEDFGSSDDDGKPIVMTPGNYTEDAEIVFSPRNTKRLIYGVPPSAFRFSAGDLTVVMTDLSSKMKILGRPAFVNGDNVLHNQRIGKVVFRDNSIDPRLVYFAMQTSTALSRIRDTATGTMVRHTAPKRILANPITYPPDIRDQRTLVERLDRLRSEANALRELQLAKIKTLTALKQSLLRRAFIGELTAAMPETIAA